MRNFTRVNNRIRVPEVRCVGPDGEMIGVMKTSDALKRARQAGLDLVEISPSAKPPVCRIMDHGKYRYDQNRKNKAARKQQHAHAVKEIKFHSNVEEHDYQTKLGRIRQFLDKGHKVKVSLMFRGRENAHRELGFQLINRVIADCDELSSVDMSPKLIGRHIVSMLAPRAAKVPTKEQSKAPVKPPAEAPAKAPAEASAKAPAEAPAKAPAEASAKAPAEAPVEAATKDESADSSAAPAEAASKSA